MVRGRLKELLEILRIWYNKITASLLMVYLRFYHGYEWQIEKSILRITVWHHEACRMMTNDDTILYLCS